MGARLLVFVKDINLPSEDPDAELVNIGRYQPGHVVDVFPENHEMGKLDWESDRFKIVDTDMSFAEAQGLKMQPDDPNKIGGFTRREFILDIKQVSGMETNLTEAISVTKETLRTVKAIDTQVIH